MLHPRNALAAQLAERFIWTAVSKYADSSPIEAAAKRALELHESDVLTGDQLQDLYAIVGCIDCADFLQTGDLDSIVRQFGMSIAGCPGSFPMGVLQRLTIIHQEFSGAVSSLVDLPPLG